MPGRSIPAVAAIEFVFAIVLIVAVVDAHCGSRRAMPYVLQPPFTAVDLSSRARWISNAETYCCSTALWWSEVEPNVSRELTAGSDGNIDVYLVTWNGLQPGFVTEHRAVPRQRLETVIATSLGSGLSNVTSVNETQANTFIGAVARLVVARQTPH